MKIILLISLITMTLFGEVWAADVLYKDVFNLDPKNYSKAVKHYQKECDGGDSGACFNLGKMYSKGYGVEKDYDKVAKLYQKVCDRGNAVACSSLGWMYFDGQSVKQNYIKAFKFYQKACDGGETSACKTAGEMYEEGKGEQKDYIKAVKYYEKACNGKFVPGLQANICRHLGFIYKIGKSVKQDYLKAAKFYGKACDSGNGYACIDLGEMYEKSENYSEAYKIYQPACNNSDSKWGCLKLGVMYEEGKGVKQDYLEAVKFYKKACDSGTYGGCHNLARMYLDGIGVEKDSRKPLDLYHNECFSRSGAGGASCISLGLIFLESRGTHIHMDAFECFDRGCDLGEGESCLNAGLMYSHGNKIKQNLSKAKKYFKKACELGNSFGCEEYTRERIELKRPQGATKESRQNYYATYKVVHVRNDDTLNVRTGTGTWYSKIGELKSYARNIKVLECQLSAKGAKWCKIEHKKGGYQLTGWVSANYIAPEFSSYTPKTKSYRVVNVQSNDTLNVREGAGDQYGVFHNLFPSARGIEILKCKHSLEGVLWCEIRYQGMALSSGWVNSKYLREE